MAIRGNSNPRPLALPPELQDILLRNGMTAQVVGSSNGFALIVQSHDSPVLTYQITEKQLKALTDWGTNTANKRAYNTFASIVASDFDMPKDFVHARNANGRVAMGLHGYRIGVGEYGRIGLERLYHGVPPHHMLGYSFLGWTPRMQEGYHLRRIGGQLYYPSAPMLPNRPDGRVKPGELANGSYGFYYKGYTTAPAADNQQDVLADLQTVITPINQPQRPTEPAILLNQAITSDVYFTNEKWQEVLASHGIVVDAEAKRVTIQSSALEADLQYNLTDDEVAKLTNNSLQEISIAQRLEILNNLLKDDFADAITVEQLNSDKLIDIKLHPEVQQELEQQLRQQEQYYHQAAAAYGGQTLGGQAVGGQGIDPDLQVRQEPSLRDNLPKGGVVMDGNDLALLDERKGWFREGRHGREVTVDDIRVEPVQHQGETKYLMTAVIDGEVVTHAISQKDYNKFMAVDDLHRMKLFSKVFSEVDMKDRYPVGLGTKITAALCAGVVVAHDLAHEPRPMHEMYMDVHPGPRVYFKPGVDTPADVAARQFDDLNNAPGHGPGLGRN